MTPDERLDELERNHVSLGCLLLVAGILLWVMYSIVAEVSSLKVRVESLEKQQSVGK